MQNSFQTGLSAVQWPPQSTRSGYSETLLGCAGTEDWQHECAADESTEIMSRRTELFSEQKGGPPQYQYGVPN